MQFHIVNIEPNGFRFGHFLDYHCKLMCLGLESLGHDCSIGCNQMLAGRVNILVGAHTLSSPDDVEAIASTGPYIVAQSEIIRQDGINTLGNRETLQEVYLPLLMGAQAVWEAIPQNIPILRNLGIAAHQTTAGYHPQLEQVVHKKNKDIDFAFFGSQTPHRNEMLGALKDRGFRIAVLFDARQIYRDDLIARTKVNLSPNQGADMDHLPYGRICFLLNNRCLVVVERCRDQEWLEGCFVSSSTENWVDVCEETLNRADREQLREQCFDRYRETSFTDHLRKLLDASFPPASSGLPLPKGLVAQAPEVRRVGSTT